MVTVIGLEKRKNKKEEEFNVLILQGDVETIISKVSLQRNIQTQVNPT